MADWKTVARFTQFPLDEKALLFFSDEAKLRCDKPTSSLQLRKQATGFYPLTSDLYVRGPLLNPTAVRQWFAFFADVTEPKVDLVTVGTVRYRLNNGTTDYWWDGSAWDSAPVAGEWNTLAEIQAHFTTFTVVARKLRIVFNLKTTDKTVTPVVSSYSLMFKAAIVSFHEEILLRMLVPELRNGVRPARDIAYKWAGGTTLDLDPPTEQKSEPIRTTDVVAAFNVTDDPTMAIDILSGYNTSTHVVTLTGAVSAGKDVVLRHKYIPTVAIATHPDYSEIPTLPAILLTQITSSLLGHSAVKTTIVAVATNAAVSMRAPRQTVLRVTLTFAAARLLDLERLQEATMAFLVQHPLLKIKSLDIDVGVVVQEDPSMAPRSDASHALESSMSVALWSACAWLHEPQTGYGVDTTNFDTELL